MQIPNAINVPLKQRQEIGGRRGCTLGASDDASAFGLQVCIVALLCARRQTTAAASSATRTTFNCLPLPFPPFLSSLRLSFFFLFSVSLSFSLLATRNRIKFAPWEFQLLFFKNRRQLPPDPPLFSYPCYCPFPCHERNIDLPLSPSLSLRLRCP